MKVMKRHDVGPINLAPGDAISVVYNEPNRPPRELVRHTLTEACTVDHALLVELSEEVAAALGLADGIGGIVGRRT